MAARQPNVPVGADHTQASTPLPLKSPARKTTIADDLDLRSAAARETTGVAVARLAADDRASSSQPRASLRSDLPREDGKTLFVTGKPG